MKHEVNEVINNNIDSVCNVHKTQEQHYQFNKIAQSVQPNKLSSQTPQTDILTYMDTCVRSYCKSPLVSFLQVKPQKFSRFNFIQVMIVKVKVKEKVVNSSSLVVVSGSA